MSNFLEENIIKENFSNKPNLLFLIGHLRTIEIILKYHKKFLDQTESDLIISTWKDDESNNELKWSSEDGDVRVVKRIHVGKDQSGSGNMEFIIDSDENELHENGDKIMIRKKIKRKKK